MYLCLKSVRTKSTISALLTRQDGGPIWLPKDAAQSFRPTVHNSLGTRANQLASKRVRTVEETSNYCAANSSYV